MNKKITGTHFYYYFVCHRKLWYFSHGIVMEHENEDVALGKLLDESTYNRENRRINIDNVVNIDFIQDFKVLHEVKKSKSIEEAGIWQLKYYIYYLKQKGIEDLTGVIDYPKLRRREDVELSQEDVEEIEKILGEIEIIQARDLPPEKIKQKFCKKCAYYDLCYV